MHSRARLLPALCLLVATGCSLGGSRSCGFEDLTESSGITVAWAFSPTDCLSCGDPAWIIRHLEASRPQIASRLLTTAGDSTLVATFAERARVKHRPAIVRPSTLTRCYLVDNRPTLVLIRDSVLVWRRAYPNGPVPPEVAVAALNVILDSLGHAGVRMPFPSSRTATQ